MANFNSITYEGGTDGVAIITLNRPIQLNSLSPAMGDELIRALDQADEDSNVRVVILTGAGSAFSVGADLTIGSDVFTPVNASENGSMNKRDWGGILVLRLFNMLKPTIAAVNGASVGVGATLTLPCDIRIASTRAKFGFVFTRRGIVTDGCASWFLPRVVGIATSLRWCLGGELVTADQALEAGLISEIHEPENLLAAAHEIAMKMTSQTSPVAVSLTRRLLWQGLVENHPMGSHRLESMLIGFTLAGCDAHEGVESFLEKRPARFTSRVPDDLPAGWPLWQEPTF